MLFFKSNEKYFSFDFSFYLKKIKDLPNFHTFYKKYITILLILAIATNCILLYLIIKPKIRKGY